MANQKGLGKGLDTLIRRTDNLPPNRINSNRTGGEVQGAMFVELDLADIRPNPRQPRHNFDTEQLEELVESVKEVGVLQPVVVRKVGAGYELIMGERRWRACQMAGLTKIPAIVRETSDNDLLRDALLENIHRSQLNPLEEAAAYQQLLDDFNCSKEELSTKIKRSRPHISNTLRLLKLPASVQRRVAVGVLSAGHARALLTLDDPVLIEQIAQRIVAEGLSVRGTEELVALQSKPQKEPVKRGPRPENPRAIQLASQLGDIYDTRVRVDIGKNKGQIVLEFAGEEDLERLLGLLQK